MRKKQLSLPAVLALPMVSLLLTLLSAGCSKKNNDSDTANSATIAVTVGGSSFRPSLTNAIYGSVSHSYVLAGYTVNNGDSTIITIDLNAPFSLNTELGTTAKAFVTYQDNGKKYLAGTGSGPLSCQVTALDSVKHTLTGTFSGTLFALSNRDTLSMTTGTFSATYSVVNNF